MHALLVPPMADAELKQRKPVRGGAAPQQPPDAEEEAKPLAPAAAQAAPAAAPAAAAAIPHTLALTLLAACLVLTYSLESLAPTLDYVGRYIMLAVQLAHLAASAAFGVRQDWLVAAALANAAAYTRFWRIEDPQSIIFDEVRERARSPPPILAARVGHARSLPRSPSHSLPPLCPPSAAPRATGAL